MEGKSLTSGTPWKLILRFALPVFAGILLQQLYNTVDTIVIGNFVSEDALSAVGTTTCLTMFFLALANGFSAGAGILVAQLFGAKNEERLKKISSASIFLMLMIGTVSIFIGYFLCTPAFKLLSVPKSLISMASTYFKIYSLGLIFQFGYNIIAAVLRAIGDSKATLYFLGIASLVNIVLDILFVTKFNLGVAGVALATDIAQMLSCIAAFVYMWIKYPALRISFKHISYVPEFAFEILRTGSPMALQQLIVSFGFFFLQNAVNSYGKEMMASFTVGMKVETYLTISTNAFQITLATYSGQNLGADKPDRANEGTLQTIVLSFISGLIISLAVYICAPSILKLFGLGEKASFYCLQHLRTTCITMLVLAIYFPILGTFQGAGRGFVATLVAMTALSMRVITTYTFCYIPLFDYRIIWWNQLFGFLSGATLTWSYFFFGKWKKPKIMC